MPAPLKIGLVGLGAFGKLHAATLARLHEFDLVAVCDHEAAVADAVAGEHGTNAFCDFPQMLETGGLEAVVIATRTESHVPLASAALRRGVHVLVEKPLAGSEAEILRLGEVRAETGRVVMADHVCLFHSTFGTLQKEVQTRGFRSIRFVRHRPAWMVKRFSEENPVRMTMMHDLYQAAALLEGEEPERVEGWASRTAEGKIDLTWARLEWPGERSITLESHWVLPDGVPYDGWDYAEVFGPGHYLKVSTNPGAVWQATDRAMWPIALEMSEVHGRPVGMLAECSRSFAEACRTGEVPKGCRLEDACRIERWMAQILKKMSNEQ